MGLDMEMHFNEHYSECLDQLDKTFNCIFKGLNERFRPEIEAVRKQYPFDDLKFKYPCQKPKSPFVAHRSLLIGKRLRRIARCDLLPY